MPQPGGDGKNVFRSTQVHCCFVSVTALAEFDQQKNLVFINGIVQDITLFQEHQPE
ncbi:MAG: hypothetical protein LUQ54_03495 [Methanoregula sp.]|nr:hypothetical protein [Methanoregula sp.]